MRAASGEGPVREADRTHERLSGVPLFRDLDADTVERIARFARRRSYPRDVNIVSLGEPGHALYVVLEGEVDVIYPARSTEFRLGRLGPGECFGEMAILNDMPRSATVRTTGPVEVLVLEREDFERVVREEPAIAMVLLDVLSRRIRNADDQLGGLSERAMRDPLTGLLNRRAFHERLGEEVDRARRYGDPFSLILIDLDRFAVVNDVHGHEVGDVVLEWVGRILVEHTRHADSAYRVGGEEFAVLCPASEGGVARSAAERLVSVVGQATPPLDIDLDITLSAGYASCPAEARSADGIFVTADRALMRAKATGRNRVCGTADLR